MKCALRVATTGRLALWQQMLMEIVMRKRVVFLQGKVNVKWRMTIVIGDPSTIKPKLVMTCRVGSRLYLL